MGNRAGRVERKRNRNEENNFEKIRNKKTYLTTLVLLARELCAAYLVAGEEGESRIGSKGRACKLTTGRSAATIYLTNTINDKINTII